MYCIENEAAILTSVRMIEKMITKQKLSDGDIKNSFFDVTCGVLVVLIVCLFNPPLDS